MPTYDLRCLACGREWERASMIAARYDPCDACGGSVEQVFKHSVQSTPFVAYFDVGLGREILGLGDRRAAMRGEIDDVSGERRNKLDYREKLAPGEISARQDRLRQQQRDARHG